MHRKCLVLAGEPVTIIMQGCLTNVFLFCSWIDLGHACASEIQPHSDNTTFLDIFDYTPQNSTAPCEPGFTSVNTGNILFIIKCYIFCNLHPDQDDIPL